MSILKQFIESNYRVACETQRSFNHDIHMQNMLAKKTLDEHYVKNWMQGYGLFRGILTCHRRQVVKVYKENIFTISNPSESLTHSEVEKFFSVLLSAFYGAVPQKWISAVSKLLWCSFPHEIAIYDGFVHRSMIVLQGVTPYLAEMPRLGDTPILKTESDIPRLVDFYMNYREMILAIQSHHQDQLNSLRRKYSEQYAYDIRILDKLLWLLGGPGKPITLGTTKCI